MDAKDVAFHTTERWPRHSSVVGPSIEHDARSHLDFPVPRRDPELPQVLPSGSLLVEPYSQSERTRSGSHPSRTRSIADYARPGYTRPRSMAQCD